MTRTITRRPRSCRRRRASPPRPPACPRATSRRRPRSARVVTVTNPLAIARPAETIELPVADLQRVLTFDDVRKVHVRDDASGKDLLTQAVDLDDDGTFEQVIFQADLAASDATRRSRCSVGERHIPARDEFKAYGRFVRERRDDFAWENDLVAHRMYGAALETWAQEPLTSSAVDVWVKRTHRLVINDWYMIDDYHARPRRRRRPVLRRQLARLRRQRHLAGRQAVSVGQFPRLARRSPTARFACCSSSPTTAGTRGRSEAQRSQAHHARRRPPSQSVREPLSRAVAAAAAAGGRHSQERRRATSSERRDAGVLRTWEAFKDKDGNLGCGVIVDPRDLVDMPRVDNNYLARDARRRRHAGGVLGRHDVGQGRRHHDRRPRGTSTWTTGRPGCARR